jgi:uncharacterized protein involved in exopolysaccharide biosynthesis
VSAALQEIFAVPGNTADQRRENAVIALRNSIVSSLNPKTGVITFSVRSQNPELSFQISNRLLAEVNRFNLERRQTQAGVERKFTEARLATVREELRDAESRLQRFLQDNREYARSPTLSFEADRLQRDVALRQQIYTSFAQAFEQSKIEEVRDTPLITAIEQPATAAWPDGRGLTQKGVLALAIGAMLGLIIAATMDWFGHAKTDSPDEVTEFATLRRATLADLRHPARAIHRAVLRRD